MHPPIQPAAVLGGVEGQADPGLAERGEPAAIVGWAGKCVYPSPTGKGRSFATSGVEGTERR